jgi:hypothetical protein
MCRLQKDYDLDKMLGLLCHPKTPANAVLSVSAHAKLTPDGVLQLRYSVEVPHDSLMLAPLSSPVRQDNLWKTTCFEVFLRHGEALPYIELNFSPSRAWAAYQFSDYRQGMAPLSLNIEPVIQSVQEESHFVLDAMLALPSDFLGREIKMAICAVIEEKGGTKSYWALSHVNGDPDFHDQTCFTHQLKAAAHNEKRN